MASNAAAAAVVSVSVDPLVIELTECALNLRNQLLANNGRSNRRCERKEAANEKAAAVAAVGQKRLTDN